MLNLLMMLARGKGHNYIRVIIIHLLIMLRDRRRNMPAWRILLSGLSNFNEEAGELSFSVLSRACLGDTQTGNHEHLAKLFRLFNVYSAVEAEIEADLASERNFTSWRKKIDPMGEDVQATIVFVRNRLREIALDQCLVYDGTEASYKSRLHANTQLQTIKPKLNPLWIQDITTIFVGHLSKTQEMMNGEWSEWGSIHLDIWPELQQVQQPQDEEVYPRYDEDDSESADDEPNPELQDQPMADIAKASKAKSKSAVSGDEDADSDSSEYADARVPESQPAKKRRTKKKTVKSRTQAFDPSINFANVDPNFILPDGCRRRKKANKHASDNGSSDSSSDGEDA